MPPVFYTQRSWDRELGGGGMHGGADPNEEVYLQAANQAYNKEQTALPGGYEPVPGGTDTIKAWKRPDSSDIVFGVRGTADARDMQTNANLVINNLRNTDRYKEDEATVKRILAQYPDAKAHLASHSLGSAVARELEDVIPVASSKGYNAAYQPSHLLKPGKQQRHYKGSDFLGQIGRYIPGAKHTPVQPKTWSDRILSYMPGPSWNPIKHHSLKNFWGGAKRHYGPYFIHPRTGKRGRIDKRMRRTIAEFVPDNATESPSEDDRDPKMGPYERNFQSKLYRSKNFDKYMLLGPTATFWPEYKEETDRYNRQAGYEKYPHYKPLRPDGYNPRSNSPVGHGGRMKKRSHLIRMMKRLNM